MTARERDRRIRFLVLAHAGDRGAAAVAAGLSRRHGAGAVELVSADELMLATRWTHRLGGGTEPHSQVTLPDGSRIDSDRVGVTFNRLCAVDLPSFDRGAGRDRDYALAEMHALLASWLASLPCPVVNRGDAGGLSGDSRGRSAWLTLARRVGFPIRTYVSTDNARRFGARGYVSCSAPTLPTQWARGPLLPTPRHLLGSGPGVFLEEVGEEARSLFCAGRLLVGACPDGWDLAVAELQRRSGLAVLELRHAAAANGRGAAGRRVCDIDPFPAIDTAEKLSAVLRLLEGLEGGS